MAFVVKGREIAKQYAQQCAIFAGVDFSESSIRQVDLDLKRMAKDHEKNPIEIEDRNELSRQYGSYVGEVYRRHHGGVWGAEESLSKENALGIQKGNQTFWPWYMCSKILKGGDGTIAWYYGYILMGLLHFKSSLNEIGNKVH